ncbi:MAG TPA: hypothetical protein VL486_08055 [Verrucomicrobiae bacterium]|nr:hypothetical protein [Verrucomicrobiae bacterium]
MNKTFTPLVVNASADPSSSASLATHAAHSAEDQPTVTLKRDGDRVTHIVVRCTCGQVMELACEY